MSRICVVEHHTLASSTMDPAENGKLPATEEEYIARYHDLHARPIFEPTDDLPEGHLPRIAGSEPEVSAAEAVVETGRHRAACRAAIEMIRSAEEA